MTRLSFPACTVLALITCVLLALLWPPSPANANQPDDRFETVVSGLSVKNFKKKSIAVERLVSSGDPRTVPVLQAMLKGQLFYIKSGKRMVYGSATDDGYRVTTVVGGEVLGEMGKRAIKKVSVNNRIRKQLRSAIARLSLADPDPEVRLDAARELLRNLTPEAAELVRSAVVDEPRDKVRAVLETGLAILNLDSGDQAEQLAAIASLDGSLVPEARNRLSLLVEETDDETLRSAALASLKGIESTLRWNRTAETVFFGISLGSVLLLAAIGLSITFGVMGVINMAHGELIMLGAYTTYVVQLLMPNHIGLSVLVAIPAAFCVSGLFGIVIERGIIRFLYGRPLETLLATFGISLILQQLVRTIFSPLNRAVSTPPWMSGSLEINGALSLTYNRLYIIVFSLMAFLFLLVILKRTALGLQVRAVTQNRQMARAMGVRTGRVDALTFGLGSGIAGVAGVALSQLTNVGPNLGQTYIIDSFMVVVFGGVGNLWGTLVAAMSLGVANKLAEPWAGAVLAKILILVFIILFIQRRPRGLFPQKGRSAEH